MKLLFQKAIPCMLCLVDPDLAFEIGTIVYLCLRIELFFFGAYPQP